MTTPNTQACIVIIGLEAIAGLCSNAFIIFSLILTSIERRNISSCNCILISLSISNVCFTIITAANFLINHVWPSLLQAQNVFLIVYSITLCSVTSSIWLTAILCFFYFIKIHHFQRGILAWVKMKIDKIVPWLILTSEFVSLSAGFVSLLISSPELSKNSTNPLSDVNFEQTKTKLTLTHVSLILNSLAFLVAIMSTSSCVRFLKVQRRSGTFGTTNVRDYQGAVQTMACLVFFYAIIYLAFILLGLQIFPNRSWGYWSCVIILFSFSLVQSGLLISGNPKLREAWRQAFTFR